MNNIKQEILTDLSKAKSSIKVAVSWFTDTDLISKILNIKQQNSTIKVTIILSDHHNNRNYGD